ncbi:hypothetical protein ACRRTK_024940 [Alexandromys fortis]
MIRPTHTPVCYNYSHTTEGEGRDRAGGPAALRPLGARRRRARAAAGALPVLLGPSSAAGCGPRALRGASLPSLLVLPGSSRAARSLGRTPDRPGPDMARGQQKIQSQQKNAQKQAGQKKKQGHTAKRLLPKLP